MEQHYKFSPRDFDKNGFGKDGSLFSDYVQECEGNFRTRFSPFYPNYFYGNHSVMILLKQCHESDPSNDWGMDLINGQADISVNSEIDTYSSRGLIYAMGSAGNDDEPMYLVVDEKMRDGIFLLKYILNGPDLKKD